MTIDVRVDELKQKIQNAENSLDAINEKIKKYNVEKTTLQPFLDYEEILLVFADTVGEFVESANTSLEMMQDTVTTFETTDQNLAKSLNE